MCRTVVKRLVKAMSFASLLLESVPDTRASTSPTVCCGATLPFLILLNFFPAFCLWGSTTCRCASLEDLLSKSLHAWMPSSHVCSEFSEFPHFLNQEPPGVQQLSLPELFLVPHLGHTRPVADVIGSVVTDDVSVPTVIGIRGLILRVASVPCAST